MIAASVCGDHALKAGRAGIQERTGWLAPIWVGVITFGCVSAGMCLGMAIRARLPKGHLDSQTVDTIKLATGMVATLSALVLGLLLAFADGSFRAKDDELTQMSSDLIRVHRILHAYGPDAAQPQALLQAYAVQKRHDLFPAHSDQAAMLLDIPALDLLSRAAVSLLALQPATPGQTWLQQTALHLLDDISQKHWLLFEQSGQRLPMLLVALLIFWLTLIFIAFGVLSPRYPIAIGAHLLCAVAVAGALVMILEMGDPFMGWIRLSHESLNKAVTTIGR